MSRSVSGYWKLKVKKARKYKTKKQKMKSKLRKEYKKIQIRVPQEKASYFNTTEK
jgi:hypothetical protein